MLTLVVKQLTEFTSAVRRDLIADGISRPCPPTDKDFIKSLVTYGNAFLERAKAKPENDGAVIWFDINFGDPAVIGMTWAYNPNAPVDPSNGLDFFWRLWSETDPQAGSLTQCQEDFAAYCVAR